MRCSTQLETSQFRFFLLVFILFCWFSFSEGINNGTEDSTIRSLIPTNSSADKRLKVKLALMGVMYNRYGPPTQLFRMGSAFIMALEDSNRMNSRIELSYTIHDSACDPRKSVSGLVDVVRDYDIYGVIGPACSSAVISLGYLASHWNIPVIGYT